MLSLLSSNRVTFNVNVQGTAATPSVRVVVGSEPGMSYAAKKIEGDDLYEVLIDLPKTMQEGSQPFKVEVLLNGRLFTPINNSIIVGGEQFSKNVEEAIETLKDVVQEPVAPAPKQKAPGLISKLEAIAKAPAPKKKPVTAEVKSVRISMADIAADAERKEPPAKIKEPAPAPKRVVEQIKTIPLTLTKGEIIYR